MGIRRFVSQRKSRQPGSDRLTSSVPINPSSMNSTATAETEDLRALLRRKFMGMIECHDNTRRKVLATARRSTYRYFGG